MPLPYIARTPRDKDDASGSPGDSDPIWIGIAIPRVLRPKIRLRMNARHFPGGAWLGALLFNLSLTSSPAAPTPTLIRDEAVTIRSATEVEARRRVLIRYVWGAEGFPKSTQQPDALVTNVPSPVPGLLSLRQVDEFRFRQLPDLEGLAYHFVPTQPNGQLVVVHHGHACTLDDDASASEVGYGLRRTIQALLQEGYGVLGGFMPHQRPGDCTGDHEKLMGTPTTGSPLKFFLEPVVLSLNYLEGHGGSGNTPSYRTFHMIGLSGGGWTTTLCAALDPRIRLSFPVAGSLPLYLRAGGSIGDREQYEASFYQLAGYPDLYVLSSHGSGRGQVQILVRRDDCCFGVGQHDEASAGLPYERALRDYEGRVSTAIRQAGPGFFRVVIDEVAPSHMISHHVIAQVILPELRKAAGAKAEPIPSK